MATYELIYDDGLGHAMIATRKQRPAAARLFKAWGLKLVQIEGLSGTVIERQVIEKANDIAVFSVAALRHVKVGNGYVRFEKTECA